MLCLSDSRNHVLFSIINKVRMLMLDKMMRLPVTPKTCMPISFPVLHPKAYSPKSSQGIRRWGCGCSELGKVSNRHLGLHLAFYSTKTSKGKMERQDSRLIFWAPGETMKERKAANCKFIPVLTSSSSQAQHYWQPPQSVPYIWYCLARRRLANSWARILTRKHEGRT